MTRSIINKWGWEDLVKSPTYTLCEEYDLDEFLFLHIDLYRTNEAQDIDIFNLDRVLSKKKIVLIEWPERLQHDRKYDLKIELKKSRNEKSKYGSLGKIEKIAQNELNMFRPKNRVLINIYDYLKEKIAEAQSKGISRKRIIIDPGIGFGKSFSHNMEIIKNAILFLGLGCPLMIGLSRKSFIGEIISERLPAARLVGSIAAMLKMLSNGVNIFRVHDVKETSDAIKVWNIFQ